MPKSSVYAAFNDNGKDKYEVEWPRRFTISKIRSA